MWREKYSCRDRSLCLFWSDQRLVSQVVSKRESFYKLFQAAQGVLVAVAVDGLQILGN